MNAALLDRKQLAFVLWRLANPDPPPTLVIGQPVPGSPITLEDVRVLPMSRVPGFDDLWQLPAAQCNLADGEVYHYWFEDTASKPREPVRRLRITDPAAYSVDWRILAGQTDPTVAIEDRYPPAVIRFRAGKLEAADGPDDIGVVPDEPPTSLPTNNRLVIYELPTAWTRSAEIGGRDVAAGSFADVIALVDANATGANFTDSDIVQQGRSYLADELGINALELLPPADSVYDREWGYGTTNYLAPDFELGFPATYSNPEATRDLKRLVSVCHAHHIRFFVDVVMAFSKDHPYLAAAPEDFFILNPTQSANDPDAHNSRNGGFRDGFGASLFRYARAVTGYDPISGQQRSLYPARSLMQLALARWMQDFGIDGIRMDSVENVANWDFIGEYKNAAVTLYRSKFATQQQADERFLVVGEELSEPLALLGQNRLHGLWHEQFKRYIRVALLGRNHENETSFEATVRRALDCRSFGYRDLAQAIIYLTSHDVEGPGNERLFNYFMNTGVTDAEKRTKLAFACLLTAVGVPMILAGDEFADQHDLFDSNGNVTQSGGKQVDPVNFARLNDDWRKRIATYVARLIRLRTDYDALSVNDIDFIHVDFTEGKRVLVWRRGFPSANSQVVVVANFSDYATPNAFSAAAEYVVPNWPETPAGKHWREIPQDRDVLPAQVGREPIFSWEAKVYALI